MKYHIALQSLCALMRSLFDQAEIARLLTLESEQDETFWEQQKRTVSHRTYAYLLAKQNAAALTQDLTTLSPADASLLYDALAQEIQAGLTYEKVRQWWLVQGQSLHRRAFAAQREAQQIRERALVVLVFFEGTSPLWLAYDEAGAPVLQPTRDTAYRFPVLSPTDLTPASLAMAAADFAVLCKLVGATHVKVLPLSPAA